MLSGHRHVQRQACPMKLHKEPIVVIVAAVMLVSCGSTALPTSSTTNAPTVTPTPALVATPTPAPATTAAATVDELSVVASMIYRPCTPANCAGDARYTTCDASSSGPDVFAPCPLTTKLDSMLKSDVDGVPGAPDPIGGGQDPEWLTEFGDSDAFRDRRSCHGDPWTRTRNHAREVRPRGCAPGQPAAR